MAKELFRMENIVKTFPGVKALDNVSISVNEGEVHGLMGENGAGKSTLMNVMCGVHQADSGKIYIRGEEVKINNIAHAQELGVTIIHQELNLLPDMTVADNIYMGRQPKKGPFIDDTQMHEDAKKILNDLGIDIDTRTIVGDLSVAEQQMVEIAKAVSMNSQILVLDEPTSSLTGREIEQLFEIIRNLQAEGVGMVYISHRMEELEQICERVTVIRDGQYIGTEKLADITLDELVHMIVGRSLDSQFPDYERKIEDEVMLEVKDLKSSKYNLDVDHLYVRKGEIIGLTGLVGAGRSEIVRTIFGAEPYDSMTVLKEGKEISIKSVRDAMDNGIGYATEDRRYDGLALNLDVKYNVNMAHLKELSKGGVIDDKQGVKNAEFYKDELAIKTPSINQEVGNLSGGNQQKVVLAKWLVNDVDVLIIDEPTRGIDVGSKYEIYELLNDLSDQGKAIIMISSDMPEILGMTDRVLVVHEGKLNGEFVTKETNQEELMHYNAGYNLLGKAKA